MVQVTLRNAPVIGKTINNCYNKSINRKGQVINDKNNTYIINKENQVFTSSTRRAKYLHNNNNNNNKMTSLAPISSENPSSVAQQNKKIRHSLDHVQCKKPLTDGWRCQVAKEDRQF